MKELIWKKWLAGCIVIIIILSVVTTNCILSYSKLKNQAAKHVWAEWYQLYSLFEFMDTYYIKSGFSDGAKYIMYVNQVCYHYDLATPPGDLNLNMRHLLITYDKLFKDLSSETGPRNKERASEIFKGMNENLLIISNEVTKMQYKERRKLLEQKSSVYTSINTKVKSIDEKYTKLVDNYFKIYF